MNDRPTVEETARRKRLPMWAQAELERLELRLERLELRLAERTRERDALRANEPSHVAVNPGGIEDRVDFYLNDQDCVRFAFHGSTPDDWKNWIDVKIEDGRLFLHSAHQLTIHPHVTNAVYVEVKKH